MTEPKREQLGHYELIRRIGEGGMGEVLEAFDPRIERRAAIKRMHPHLSRDPGFALRFLNEARAVNRVHHPGLVSIYDFGQAADGALYIVMEYLDGETLQQRIQRLAQQGGLDVREVLRIGRQIASALCAVHAAGIVHRDLKPGNLMIVADPDMPRGERVKLLDFGIAKLDSKGAAGPHTRTGAGMGTVHFMAPEQCVGAGRVDGKADVYALGVILYLLLSGRRPIDAEEDVRILLMQITTPPVPLRSVAPHVSEALGALVMQMLAKLPEERPSSCEIYERMVAIEDDSPKASASHRHETVLTQRMQSTGEIAAVAGRTRSHPSRLSWFIRTFVAVVVTVGLALFHLLQRSSVHPRSGQIAAQRALYPAAPTSRVEPIKQSPPPEPPERTALEKPAPPAAQPKSPYQPASGSPARTPSPSPVVPVRSDKPIVKKPAVRLMEAADVRSLD